MSSDKITFGLSQEDTDSLLLSLNEPPQSYRQAAERVRRLLEAQHNKTLYTALTKAIEAMPAQTYNPSQYFEPEMKALFKKDLEADQSSVYRISSHYRSVVARLLPLLPPPLRVAYIVTFQDHPIAPLAFDQKLSALRAIETLGQSEFGHNVSGDKYYRYRWPLLKLMLENSSSEWIRKEVKKALWRSRISDPIW